MKYRLIIPVGLKPKPTGDEIAVAETLATFFESNIEFVLRGLGHTPDVRIVRLNQYWEIKNIRGNGPRTIANVLREAQNQSENIAISLSRTAMSAQQARGRVQQYLREGRSAVKRILIITKSEKVIVIK